MGKFFDTENWLWRWIGRLPDLFALSLLWLVCCVPVVTVFPATIALYDSIARCVRGSEGGTYRRFFRTLKQELVRGILLSLLWFFLGFVLYCGYNAILDRGESNAVSAFSLVYLVSMVIPFATLCWLVPLESRFQYGFWQLHRNAALVAFGHLPSTAAIAALFWGAATLVYNMPVLLPLIPATLVCLQVSFTERVMKKMMPEEE